MNYSHNYYKLRNSIYTTIRKTKKAYQKIGFMEREIVNGEILHNAQILKIEKVILEDLPESFLIMDCIYPNSNIDSREKCYELFQSFYRNKIDFSKQEWYLFLLGKLN